MDENTTNVLVDDIISKAHTMTNIVIHLMTVGMTFPICLGIHPVFSVNAYHTLLDSEMENTVHRNTSGIITKEVAELMHHII